VSLGRRVFAESLGSLLLAATVIGSGIMAERLAAGNAAVALLANTAATVAALAVLIAMLGPVSGAHFNPAVSIVQALRGELRIADTLLYVPAQIAGCVLGALLAHGMFELPLIQSSTHIRTGSAQWVSEGVATAGLIVVILGSATVSAASWRVPAWIGAAYWFTASTSFANPAITVGRAFSNTFAGIRPADAPMFILAQLVGALAGLGIAKLLFTRPGHAMEPTAEGRNS
jgi:glycerol uptake facilitator-like aquaporin